MKAWRGGKELGQHTDVGQSIDNSHKTSLMAEHGFEGSHHEVQEHEVVCVSCKCLAASQYRSLPNIMFYTINRISVCQL